MLKYAIKAGTPVPCMTGMLVRERCSAMRDRKQCFEAATASPHCYRTAHAVEPFDQGLDCPPGCI